MSLSPPKPPEPSGSGYFSRGYFAVDTIAAVSSALGGAIAIVRVSGPRALEILGVVTGHADPTARFPAREMIHTRLLGPKNIPMDDAVAARFQAPHSFTGEDLVELHLHGSGFIANQVLSRLLTLGARQAQRGEFSFRAVRNGKLSITQAQAVADLISATQEDAVALALEKLSGTQNRLIRGLADSLRTLAVLAEAGIDFADQEIDAVSLPVLKKGVGETLAVLTQLKESYARGTRLQAGVSVAFIGLPNVGKSSFFNAVLGEDRAIVSEQAGTTRDVLREQITLRSSDGSSSATFRLQDTAGLRATDDPVENQGIGRTEKAARTADINVLLVAPGSDSRAVQEQWDRLELSFEKSLGVLTKCDLIPPTDRAAEIQNLASLRPPLWIQTSSLSGEGIGPAIDALVRMAGEQTARSQGEILLTRLDQMVAVGDAIGHLLRAVSCPQEDLFASDLRQALFSLSPLIGDTLPDDILGRIFSDFCIGK